MDRKGDIFCLIDRICRLFWCRELVQRKGRDRQAGCGTGIALLLSPPRKQVCGSQQQNRLYARIRQSKMISNAMTPLLMKNIMVIPNAIQNKIKPIILRINSSPGGFLFGKNRVYCNI